MCVCVCVRACERETDRQTDRQRVAMTNHFHQMSSSLALSSPPPAYSAWNNFAFYSPSNGCHLPPSFLAAYLSVSSSVCLYLSMCPVICLVSMFLLGVVRRCQRFRWGVAAGNCLSHVVDNGGIQLVYVAHSPCQGWGTGEGDLDLTASFCRSTCIDLHRLG